MTSILNLNQSPNELDRVCETDYYWYLHSRPFREAFLWPLARRINRLRSPCLDAGCGGGWLADYVTVPYVGFDGSAAAVERARQLHPKRMFHVGRIEAPDPAWGRFGTVVFGNLLIVLVRQDQILAFLDLYRCFDPSWLVVYDLEILDHAVISAHYKLTDEYHASVDLDGIDEVKRHRKILVYSCR